MKKISRNLLASGVLILIASANPSAQTQADMEKEACAEYKTADAEMNRAYKQILDGYRRDVLFIEKLKAAQRAWIKFRDADLEALYPEPDARVTYGSVNPMCRCIALAKLTRERTQSLKRWVDGIEEGDVCAGSIKIKN